MIIAEITKDRNYIGWEKYLLQLDYDNVLTKSTKERYNPRGLELRFIYENRDSFC